MPHFPEAVFRLPDTASPEGNVFHMSARVRLLLRETGASRHQVEAFTDAVFACGSYEEVVAVISEWVTLV